MTALRLRAGPEDGSADISRAISAVAGVPDFGRGMVTRPAP